MNPRLLLSILAFLALSPGVHADEKLPPVFSDHMILQAGMNAPVFGTADLDRTDCPLMKDCDFFVYCLAGLVNQV